MDREMDSDEEIETAEQAISNYVPNELVTANAYGSYELEKQFRHEEFYSKNNIPKKPYWTKDLINLDDKTILGKTKDDWIKTLYFYFCFFGVILLMWLTLFYGVFEKHVSIDVPYVLMKQPGVSMEPLVIDDNAARIDYDHFNLKDRMKHIEKIRQFLNKFGDNHTGFKSCTASTGYGYNIKKPCVFIKLNRIINFMPITYDAPEAFPKNAPKSLLNYMRSFPPIDRSNRVWLSCEMDNKKILIDYNRQYVRSGAIYLARKKYDETRKTKTDIQKFYDNSDFERIISLQFLNLPLNEKVVVDCRIWAKNIKIDDKVNVGIGRACFSVKIRA